MKTQPIFINLFALLCQSALSDFVEITHVEYGNYWFYIGSNGNDCAVQRIGMDVIVDYTYTSGASAGDCVGKNIFLIGSEIWVIFTVTANQKILTSTNAQSGDTTNYMLDPITDADVQTSSIVIAKIEQDDTDFGKFLWGVYDTGYNLDTSSAEPITYVSSVAASSQTTIEITVNVESGSPHGVVDYPKNPVAVNGNGVVQVFKPSDLSLTASGGESGSGSGTDSSRWAVWKLALTIALPCITLMSAAVIYSHIKYKKNARMEKFKELPTTSQPASPVDV